MGVKLFDVYLDLDFWQVLATLLKAVTYGSSLSAAGGIMFITLFFSQISRHEEQAIRRFIIYAASIAALLSVLRIIVMNIMLSGGLAGSMDFVISKMVLESREGLSTGLRIAGLVAILTVFNGPLLIKFKKSALFAAFIVAASFAFTGHATEISLKYGASLFPQALLIFHLITVSFWLGALWPLQRVTHSSDTKRIASIMHHFGQIAVVAVFLLILAGIILLWLLLGRLDLLLASAYGQFFTTKLLLVALLLTLSAINKLWLTPLLFTSNKVLIKTLRRAINAEIILACTILLTTASFTTLVGPT